MRDGYPLPYEFYSLILRIAQGGGNIPKTDKPDRPTVIVTAPLPNDNGSFTRRKRGSGLLTTQIHFNDQWLGLNIHTLYQCLGLLGESSDPSRPNHAFIIRTPGIIVGTIEA